MAVAAIFDLDGTLVTFNLDIGEWRKVLLDVLKKRGYETGSLGLATPTQDILDSARDQAGPANPGAYDDLKKEAFSILDVLELKGAESSTVFPDAVATLQYLKSKGVRLGILTNSGRKAATESLKKLGIGGYFEFVLTRDETDAMKPRPEGLVKAVSLLGIAPSEVYYIGDSRYDIMAAKRAGVNSVAIGTGNYTVESLRDIGADYAVAALSEVAAVLGV